MREYFDKELTQLNDSLIEMGGLVEQAIKNTMKMIVDGEDLLDIAREHENRINFLQMYRFFSLPKTFRIFHHI